MAKPPKSQILLDLRAVEAPDDPSAGKGRKRRLIVTAHRLWIAEGRELPMADVQSVRRTGSQTVTVRRIGSDKPHEFHLKRDDDARRLRACMVFHAKGTRGGIRGVTDWTQLMSSPYDRIDVSDTSLPSGPATAAGSAAGLATVGVQPAGGSRHRVVLIVASAVGVLALVAVVVVVMGSMRRGGGSTESPDDGQYQALAAQGDTAYDKGQFRQALGQYTKALPLAPYADQARLNRRMGECQFKLGNQRGAIQPLEEALRLGADGGAELPAMLARCYLTTRDASSAYRVLQRAKRSFPTDVEISALMAQTHFMRGHQEHAMTQAARVYREQPGNVENAKLYALLLTSERFRRYEDAVDVYLRIAGAQKDFAAYVSAIEAAAHAGNISQAETIVTQARRALPNEPLLRDRSDRDVLVAMGLVEAPPPPPPPPVEEEPKADEQPKPEPGTQPQGETGTVVEPGTEPQSEPGTVIEPGTEPQGEPGTDTEPIPPPPETPGDELPEAPADSGEVEQSLE